MKYRVTGCVHVPHSIEYVIEAENENHAYSLIAQIYDWVDYFDLQVEKVEE